MIKVVVFVVVVIVVVFASIKVKEWSRLLLWLLSFFASVNMTSGQGIIRVVVVVVVVVATDDVTSVGTTGGQGLIELFLLFQLKHICHSQFVQYYNIKLIGQLSGLK